MEQCSSEMFDSLRPDQHLVGFLLSCIDLPVVNEGSEYEIGDWVLKVEPLPGFGNIRYHLMNGARVFIFSLCEEGIVYSDDCESFEMEKLVNLFEDLQRSPYFTRENLDHYESSLISVLRYASQVVNVCSLKAACLEKPCPSRQWRDYTSSFLKEVLVEID